MSNFVVHIANANSVAELETILRQTEELELELVSLARAGFADGVGNAAAFERRAPGTGGPSPLELRDVDAALSLAQQQELIDNEVDAGKRLVCFGVARIGGSERNLATFRA